MMSDILFPEAFETSLGKTSLTMLFFDAAFDEFFRIKDTGIRSKTNKRLACMQDKNEHAAARIQAFLKRSGLETILELPGRRGNRKRRDYDFGNHVVEVVKKDHSGPGIEPVEKRAGILFDQTKNLFR